MGLPPCLPSWRSTHELFHRASPRRSAGHLVRMTRLNPCIQEMGLPPCLPSWCSTHELFDRTSLRRSAGHPARMQWNRPDFQHLKSPSPMMANETIVHVPPAGYEEMSWNNAQKQGSSLAQMVEQKDRHVVYSWPWPSRNTAQIQ